MEDYFTTLSRITREPGCIPEHTPIIDVARAFASIGMTLRNDKAGNLIAEPIPESHKSQSWAGEHYKAVAVQVLRESMGMPGETAKVSEERARD